MRASSKWSRIFVGALALLLIGLMANPVGATVASDTEMRQVADNWVTHFVQDRSSWAGSTAAEVIEVRDIVQDGLLVARCYSVSPQGYVVVPVLKELAPIFAFSDDSHLDVNATDGMGELLRGNLHAIAERYVARFGALSAPQTADILLDEAAVSNQWQHFAVDTKTFADQASKASGSRTMVGPLVTARWHQGEPFNDLCPPGTPVGCVATAMAQIMQFHQWPDEGIGDHTYYWDGDGGPGAYLTAEFWETIDWANIPDYCPYPDCSTSTHANTLAKFNYAAAVACEMDFGAEGSGVFISDVIPVVAANWRDFFLYKDGMQTRHRSGYTQQTWFDLIQAEVDAGRPMEYFMRSHAVVCDGWYDEGGIFIHLNYGWADTHNAWYAVDNIYQADPEGDIYEEFVMRYIEPDLSAVFSTQDRVGWVPFDAYFECSSEYTVTGVDWDFGDGGAGATDTCTHTYTQRGVYDVAVDLNSGAYSRSKVNYIVALADSLYADSLLIEPGVINEITVYATTAIPLSELVVPITYDGTLNINPYTITWTTVGCATDGMDYIAQTNSDPAHGRMTLRFENTGSSADLPAGEGQAIVKLQFEITGTPSFGQTAPISFATYASNVARFSGRLIPDYNPILIDGLAHFSSCCQGFRGNIDNDPAQEINIVDLIYLVNYMFQEGPDPECMAEANVDGDFMSTIDIADLIHLVNYMFQDGPEPFICY